MTKDEVVRLAKEHGLFIIECDNGGLIVEGRDSDPQGLLAFSNAIADNQYERGRQDAIRGIGGLIPQTAILTINGGVNWLGAKWDDGILVVLAKNERENISANKE